MDTGVRPERLNSLFYHFTGAITYDGLAKIFSETSATSTVRGTNARPNRDVVFFTLDYTTESLYELRVYG
jgi:hypothetical protein